MTKISKIIDGLGNYPILATGEVYSLLTFGFIGHKQPNGYIRVTLTDDNGNAKSYYAHHLVWRAFKGEIPEGMQINHIDEDKTNNSIWNLELVSARDNANYGTCKIRRSFNRKKNTILRKLEVVQLKKQIEETALDGWKKLLEENDNEITRTVIENTQTELNKLNKIEDKLNDCLVELTVDEIKVMNACADFIV